MPCSVGMLLIMAALGVPCQACARVPDPVSDEAAQGLPLSPLPRGITNVAQPHRARTADCTGIPCGMPKPRPLTQRKAHAASCRPRSCRQHKRGATARGIALACFVPPCNADLGDGMQADCPGQSCHADCKPSRAPNPGQTTAAAGLPRGECQRGAALCNWKFVISHHHG